ncbi:MAG: hypothetical protein RL497_733 [Pseudomonadota bacterium]|jgi:CRISPR-associated protein (TIGR02584 family)
MLARKKILLLVSGMSPQIVTETLYALAVKQNPAWVPDEIHLITTLQGQQQANLQLFEGSKRYAQLLTDYAIHQPITFNLSTITVIKNNQGEFLQDLRTPEDNEAAADTICNQMRELTQDDNTELHVSLAGGRKTMGFYVGYALSLFGRPQDQLSHVLVSEDYESNRDFFYPTPRTHPIPHKDGREIDAALAQVWLATI